MNNKGNALVILLIAIVVLGGAGIGIWYYIQHQTTAQILPIDDHNLPPVSPSSVISTSTRQAASSGGGISQSTAIPPSTIASQQNAPATFQFPYPVEWTENWSYVYNNVDWEDAAARFDLTGVSIGEQAPPANPYGNGTQQKGTIFGIRLTFKINNTVIQSQSQECMPLSLRRVVSEQGDLAAPLESFWTSSDGTCLGKNQTYFNESLTFPATASDTDFLFTSGGKSNVYFDVKAPSGTIKVTQEPSQAPAGN